MKKNNYLLFLLAMFATFSLVGQTSGGPDAYGYIWKSQANTALDAPNYNWIDISTIGTTITGLGDDDFVGPLNIGFDFPYYWFTYNSLYIGSNGYVSFDPILIASSGALAFPNIPTANTENNFIAPMLSDLSLASAVGGASNPGRVYMYSNNTDTCIITYSAIPFWINNTNGFGGANTFQIILSKVDSSITFQYQSQAGSYDVAYATATNPVIVGIENATGNIGLQVSNNTLPTANRAVKFYYPHPVTFQVTDVAPSWVQNTDNGGFFVPSAGSVVRESTLIENKGNVVVNTPTGVQLNIRNSIGTVVHTDGGTVTTLGLGGNALVNFNAGYAPPFPGSYAYQVTTTNSSDINPQNNVQEVEMVAVDTTNQRINLSYWNGQPAVGNLMWNGGGADDGGGIYMEPPLYSVEIVDVSVFIGGLGVQTGTNAFEIRVYDDDGPPGLGTLLASQFVSTTAAVNNAWNVVPLTTPVQIDSGGFYIGWYMTGAAIGLGTEVVSPFSLRTFEVLNDSWSPYRSRTSQEYMISVGMDKVCTATVNIDVGADTTICDNAALTLDAGVTSASYSWSTGATSQTISVTTPGTYIVDVDSSFCMGSDTIVVAVLPAPTVDLGFDQAFCAGGSTTLDAGAGFSAYMWSTGATTQTILVNTAGMYAATVTSANGCTDTDDINIAVNPNPIPDLGPDVNRCAGDMVALSAGMGFSSYSWSTGSTSNNITVNTAGKYWVNVLDMNGCLGTDTVLVAFDGANVRLGNDTTFCEGSTYTLDAGAGFAAYVWSNGTTTRTLDVTQAGTYFVTVVDGTCQGGDTITLSVDPLPISDFTFINPASPLQFAFNNSTQFGLSYVWDFGDGNSSTMTSAIHTYGIGGNYLVCLTATNACGSDSSCQLLRGVSIDPELFREEVQIFPVPAQDELKISIKDIHLQNSTLVLVDLRGKTVHTEILGDINGNHTHFLDLTNLPSGVYYLMLKSDKHLIPRKVVITR